MPPTLVLSNVIHTCLETTVASNKMSLLTSLTTITIQTSIHHDLPIFGMLLTSNSNHPWILNPYVTLSRLHRLASCPTSSQMTLSILTLKFNTLIQWTAAAKLAWSIDLGNYINNPTESSPFFHLDFHSPCKMYYSNIMLTANNQPFDNICDSGALHCAFNSLSHFLNDIHSPPSNDQLGGIANSLSIHGIGTAVITLHTHHLSLIHIKIPNSLYVPDLPCNLISP